MKVVETVELNNKSNHRSCSGRRQVTACASERSPFSGNSVGTRFASLVPGSCEYALEAYSHKTFTLY